MLNSLILDGTVTLLALAVLAAELVVVLSIRKRTGPVGGLVLNILSGAFLILALRSALLDYGGAAIALFLGLGGLAHVAELVIRLRHR